jgi:hypothetical protein
VAISDFPRPPHHFRFDHPAWQAWFNRLDTFFSSSTVVAWTDINFTGSNLTSIATRNHSSLQNIQEANPASSDATRDAHVSDNDLKLAADHRAASVIGTHVQAWDSDLDALASVSGTGLLARTGAGTASARTIVAADARLTVTNGDGVSGNPSVGVGVLSVVTKTTTYLITSADDFIRGDMTGGGFTVTLPAAVVGRIYRVKLVVAGGNLTIACDGAETIDGSATKVLTSLNESVTLIGISGGWNLI